jgi:23S rRNA (uridine2552-2'-O)-methyltransferase
VLRKKYRVGCEEGLTKKWLRERKYDTYHRRAKEDGFRSRAIYKLFQISKPHNLIKTGDTVVDLGSFPGGWIQGARMLVGEEGFVLGIDMKPIKAFSWSNVKTLVGDITSLEEGEIREELPRKADVVISDVSPNLSGIWEVDHARQMDLARKSVELARVLLHRGGNLIVKAFQGESFKELLDEVKARFRSVKVVKPKASRKRSAEVYIVARGFNLKSGK